MPKLRFCSRVVLHWCIAYTCLRFGITLAERGWAALYFNWISFKLQSAIILYCVRSSVFFVVDSCVFQSWFLNFFSFANATLNTKLFPILRYLLSPHSQLATGFGHSAYLIHFKVSHVDFCFPLILIFCWPSSSFSQNQFALSQLSLPTSWFLMLLHTLNYHQIAWQMKRRTILRYWMRKLVQLKHYKEIECEKKKTTQQQNNQKRNQPTKLRTTPQTTKEPSNSPSLLRR